jgi:hypothetical protein
MTPQTGIAGAHFLGARHASVKARHSDQVYFESDEAQRKPILLLMFVGSFLLRFVARTLFVLLFHEPPRSASQRPCIH